MIDRILGIGLVWTCVFLFYPMQSEALEEPYSDIYVAGFVLDNAGNGIQGAVINIATDESKKLFGLRSTDAGWFESVAPIPVEYLDEEIRLTVLKIGFETARGQLRLKNSDNFVVFRLEPLADTPAPITNERPAKGVIYGYVQDAVNSRPLPGAHVSLTFDGPIIADGYSMNNGYFSLRFDARKYQHQTATYTVTHPDFEGQHGHVALKQQDDVVRVRLFPKTGERFETSYQKFLQSGRNPGTEMTIRGQNENYIQVSAIWETGSKRAFMRPSFWEVRLPPLDNSDYNSINFAFIRNIQGLESSMKDDILSKLLEICDNYLDPKHPNFGNAELIEDMDEVFGAIIAETIQPTTNVGAFGETLYQTNFIISISADVELGSTGQNISILGEMQEQLRDFDPDFHDRLLLLDDIKMLIQELEIEEQVRKIIVPRSKSRLRAAVKSAAWPGWGDLPDRRVMAVSMNLLHITALAASVAFHINYRNVSREYEDARERYGNIGDFPNYLEYKTQRSLMTSKYEQAVSYRNRRNFALLFAIVGIRAISSMQSALSLSHSGEDSSNIASEMGRGILLSWRGNL